ncbi:WD40/YVTN/BNR-like repeat-containing protein [Pseudomonas fluorescens]|nr:YCF48-related protein [Pseudomonas fluorescens]
MNKILSTFSLMCLWLIAQNILYADETSSSTAFPASSLFLTSIAQAGARLVSVGERGTVLLSDDDGKSWSTHQAGTMDTLTAVTFQNDTQGFAVGHGGNILKTVDGGSSWKSVLDGKKLISLTTKAASQALAQFDKDQDVSADDADHFQAYAKRLEENGTSEPLFSIKFMNESLGFAVGAYGMILRTRDAGETWAVWMTHVDNPQELHLYTILETNGAIYLAGEQGFLARSLDGGEHFTRLETGFAGSFFTLAADKRSTLYAGGLQGQLIASSDQGTSWRKVETDSNISWIASQLDEQGNVILGNLAGGLYTVKDSKIQSIPQPDKAPLSDFVTDGKVNIITVGALGSQTVIINPNPLPEPSNGSL